MLTQKEVRDALDYDPETGIFTWKYRPDATARWNTRYAGTRAGCFKSGGYSTIGLNFVRGYYAHKVAWLWMTGDWPECEIDHKNGDCADNRFNNLRLATHQKNSANRKRPVNNTSGFKGVTRWGRKWRAQIAVEGKKMHLGLFATKEAAHAAYIAAAEKAFGAFARAA